jgi:transposase
VARARRCWIREQGLLDPARLVFIDETAVTTNMVRPNGWSPRGERLVGEVPMGHWETLTFIAGFRRTGIVAPMMIKGAMNGEAFLAYIEQCLAPTLRRRDIVVIDNVSFHKVAGVEEAIEARGAELRYFRSIRLTLTQLNWCSIPSRRGCARRPSAQSTDCSDVFAPSFEHSNLPNAQAILGTPAMIQYDRDVL